MKALFVTLGVYSSVGGEQRFSQRVVRCLAELGASDGLESWVIALWDRARDQAAAPPPVQFRAGASNKIRTAAAFLRQVCRSQPDVILYGHILLSPLALAARMLSPRSRHVLFAYGLEVWREPFRPRIPMWQRLTVHEGIDQVASISQLTSERMQRAYELPENLFSVLPCAVDPPVHGPSRRNQDGGELRLLTVTRLGRGDHYKGCDKVIRALPSVLERVPCARYDVVGEGPLRPELERLAGNLGVGSAVRFRGRVSDRELDEIYDQAHLMVMPSTGEGFGIVFLEAWRHGLPVVVGNQDASAEVVTHGVNGLCVNPESVEEISGAVVELLKDREKAFAMGQRGYQTMLERYAHPQFRGRLREILNSRPGGLHDTEACYRAPSLT